MAGRPSKPVDLIMIDGNKDHRTKAELAARKKAEQSLYTGEKFTELPSVKEDPVAHKEFVRLKRLYSNIQYVDALDTQMINRYCAGVAEHSRLRTLLDKMEEKLDAAEPEDLVQLYRAINSVIGKIQTQEKLLISYEDRLFLNPAGRMRAIPKQPEKKEATGIEAYRNRRNVQ